MPSTDAEVAPPILVTGSHRSGSTWVGSMLAQSRSIAHIHEPFNPVNRLSWLGAPPSRPFLYIADHNEADHADAVDRLVALRPPLVTHLTTVRTPRHLAANVREAARLAAWRARRARPMVKDPLAFFSTEWFAERYRGPVVALCRHPAAFAGSLKRQRWTFDFGHLTSQPQLMADHLQPFGDEIERAAVEPPDIIDQAVLLWRCINATLFRWRDRHPDWLVVRYEDLADDPVEGARTVYEAAGVAWEDRISDRVRALSSSDNPAEVSTRRTRDVRRNSAAALTTWHRRLDADEIARVRDGTADVAAGVYDDAEWAVPTR